MLLSRKYKRPTMTREEADAIIERARTEPPLELKKGEIIAMIMAAMIVFVPFLLLFSGTMGLLYFVIFHIVGR